MTSQEGSSDDGTVLLFYKYTWVPDVPALVHNQKELCERLGLTGRVRIAAEGINGTVAGSTDAVDQYEQACRDDGVLKGDDIDFKRSDGRASDFDDLQVRACEEIVTMGVPPTEVSHEDCATHLTPQEFHDHLAMLRGSDRGDAVIIDGRNYYEARIGHFAGAVLPKIRQFSEFPTFVESNKDVFEDKDVYMYCTGGIRCERASAYVKKATRAKNIFQLEGGIHRYLEQYRDGGGLFHGKNLVFDKRMAIPVENHTPVATCDFCTVPCDDYSPGFRCCYCRTRVLACAGCGEEEKEYLCRVCSNAYQAGALKKVHKLPSADRLVMAPSDDGCAAESCDHVACS